MFLKLCMYSCTLLGHWEYRVAMHIIYLVPGASDDGGEDGPGGVVAGEPGLAHARAVVHDQSGDVLVTHGEAVEFLEREEGNLREDGKQLEAST